MMRIILLAPPGSPGSGASIYNRGMVAALARLGVAAELIDLRGRYPAAAADPVDRALAGSLPADALVVIDGIALCLHAACPGLAAGLIHHPAALFGEHGPARAALEAAQDVALRAAPVLIASSAEIGERLAMTPGAGSARICVVPAGVEDVPRTAPDPDGGCRILSLGALVPRRAHDVLLRALARLTDLDWRLTLIGGQERDPGYVAVLRGMIDDGGLSGRGGLAGRVTLAGAETAPPWQASDVLALAHPVPSQDGAIRQALRRGIALVLCGTRPSAAGTAAVMCPPGDVETLSKVLRRVILDRSLRARLSEDAWQAGQGLPGWDSRARDFAAALQ